ncbi:hypothetical protein C2E21_6324 [Chlorella sorokiniana]|uniref:Uncharacterized protein n=1 Tax=Chlorella sorokiniana TaxID=3076 RepID=A0A2P6TLM9_CHLSO|nr:hypothetical protein C2E21_6324 [Chlorella sorokiniana]|eukprot:PRW45194.1 hypothetical protein C2E21_6324 [Chlorella sorokiniana]
MEYRQHLASLAEDYRRLADLRLEARRLPADAAPIAWYPVHSAILARWSGLARSLLSAIDDGVAQAGGGSSGPAVGAALGAPLSGVPAQDACAFLAALYALPSQQALAEVLCSMRRDTESGDVVFDFAIEPVLKLAKAYDCPELFQLADQALCCDPLLKLAVLMAPLRWLLLFDEYAHMSYFQNARAAAISHLSAKFTAVQNDPLLAQLSPASLLDLTRMMAFRLSTLAQSCGHVRAVQDRSLQRFTALAQEVAAPYCPDPRRANAYVTNWAVSTVSRSIKLSWMVDPAAAAQAQAQAQAQAGQAEHAAHAQAQAGQAEHAAHAQAQLQPPAQPLGLHNAASLLPPLPAVPPQPQALPLVHLPAHWQLGPAAQVALTQQRAAVTALMAQMQEERVQQLELLAGQAEMRAEELAAAQAAAASGSNAEAEEHEEEEEEEEDGPEGSEEGKEEECEDSHQDAEQEWAAQQEAAHASSAAAAAAHPRALSAAVARVQAEEDAAADSNHASPTRHSPNTMWRDSLPSVMRLPPLRLSPKSQHLQQQQAAASGVSRHPAQGARRYAPY